MASGSSSSQDPSNSGYPPSVPQLPPPPSPPLLQPPPTSNPPAPPQGAKSPSPRPREEPPAYGQEANTFPVPQSYPDVQPYPGPYSPYPNTRVQSYSVFVYSEPTWIRFLKALSIAMIIYLVFTLFVESLVELAQWNREHEDGHPHRGRKGPHVYFNGGKGVEVGRCVSGSGWQRSGFGYGQSSMTPVSTDANVHSSTTGKHTLLDPEAFTSSAEARFDFPFVNSTKSSLMVLARGGMSAGDMIFMTSPAQRKDIASVIVRAMYFEEKVRDREGVKVCEVVKGGQGKGVAIFTPETILDDDGLAQQMYFETVVVLPESENGSPFMAGSLETDAPNTSHRIVLDGTKVQFENVAIRGSNAPVVVDALLTRTGLIGTTNGKLSVNIEASEYIHLRTENGQVKARVAIRADGSLRVVPRVDIWTTNSLLQAHIDLQQQQQLNTSKPPVYQVETHTTNSRLDVTFGEHAPANTVLLFNGTTSNGAANVQLYPSYEGTFKLETTNAAVDIRHSIECGQAQCPRRRTRNRVVRTTQLEGETELEALGRRTSRWGMRGRVKNPSSVSLRSSNSPAVVGF